jgi:hypothetical protein
MSFFLSKFNWNCRKSVAKCCLNFYSHFSKKITFSFIKKLKFSECVYSSKIHSQSVIHWNLNWFFFFKSYLKKTQNNKRVFPLSPNFGRTMEVEGKSKKKYCFTKRYFFLKNIILSFVTFIFDIIHFIKSVIMNYKFWKKNSGIIFWRSKQ